MEKSEGMKKEVKSMKLVKEEGLQRLFGMVKWTRVE